MCRVVEQAKASMFYLVSLMSQLRCKSGELMTLAKAEVLCDARLAMAVKKASKSTTARIADLKDQLQEARDMPVIEITAAGDAAEREDCTPDKGIDGAPGFDNALLNNSAVEMRLELARARAEVARQQRDVTKVRQEVEQAAAGLRAAATAAAEAAVQEKAARAASDKVVWDITNNLCKDMHVARQAMVIVQKLDHRLREQPRDTVAHVWAQARLHVPGLVEDTEDPALQITGVVDVCEKLIGEMRFGAFAEWCFAYIENEDGAGRSTLGNAGSPPQNTAGSLSSWRPGTDAAAETETVAGVKQGFTEESGQGVVDRQSSEAADSSSQQGVAGDPSDDATGGVGRKESTCGAASGCEGGNGLARVDGVSSKDIAPPLQKGAGRYPSEIEVINTQSGVEVVASGATVPSRVGGCVSEEGVASVDTVGNVDANTADVTAFTVRGAPPTTRQGPTASDSSGDGTGVAGRVNSFLVGVSPAETGGVKLLAVEVSPASARPLPAGIHSSGHRPRRRGQKASQGGIGTAGADPCGGGARLPTPDSVAEGADFCRQGASVTGGEGSLVVEDKSRG
ncbi:unnamed protein product, partial [Sphacelaria rigidula]